MDKVGILVVFVEVFEARQERAWVVTRRVHRATQVVEKLARAVAHGVNPEVEDPNVKQRGVGVDLCWKWWWWLHRH